LDDKAWLENKRIMDILRNIESNAIALRDQNTVDKSSNFNNENLINIDETSALIALPFERPLHTPSIKPIFEAIQLDSEEESIDASSLFSQRVVDKVRLLGNIRQALQLQSQITLHDLIEIYPLQEGLAELITYLQIGSDIPSTVVNEAIREKISWRNTASDDSAVLRSAQLQQMIFLR
jgi:Protein of unknown function (DUF3375)